MVAYHGFCLHSKFPFSIRWRGFVLTRVSHCSLCSGVHVCDVCMHCCSRILEGRVLWAQTGVFFGDVGASSMSCVVVCCTYGWGANSRRFCTQLWTRRRSRQPKPCCGHHLLRLFPAFKYPESSHRARIECRGSVDWSWHVASAVSSF